MFSGCKSPHVVTAKCWQLVSYKKSCLAIFELKSRTNIFSFEHSSNNKVSYPTMKFIHTISVALVVAANASGFSLSQNEDTDLLNQEPESLSTPFSTGDEGNSDTTNVLGAAYVLDIPPKKKELAEEEVEGGKWVFRCDFSFPRECLKVFYPRKPAEPTHENKTRTLSKRAPSDSEITNGPTLRSYSG